MAQLLLLCHRYLVASQIPFDSKESPVESVEFPIKLKICE